MLIDNTKLARKMTCYETPELAKAAALETLRWLARHSTSTAEDENGAANALDLMRSALWLEDNAKAVEKIDERWAALMATPEGREALAHACDAIEPRFFQWGDHVLREWTQVVDEAERLSKM